MNTYVNTPTHQLMDALEEYITNHTELSRDSRVLQAFQSLLKVSKEVPSIVRFIDEQISYSTQHVFGPKEITLIQISMLLRVLSTYAAIPMLVGRLQLIGEIEAVARINSNAIDEGGGKGNPSHHELLMNSLNIIARHIGGLPISTKHVVTAIRIYDLKNTEDCAILDNEVIWMRLINDSQYIPIPKGELPIALEVAELLDENVLRYHRHIQQTLLTPTTLETSNKQALALATLELAKREAESVDEKEGNLSFIGSWERLTKFYESRLSPEVYKKANAWAEAHNSREEAAKAGWQDKSAEDGHARDARQVALYFLRVLNPMEFAQVLEQVTENAVLRMQHWNYLLTSLNKLKMTPEYQS